MTLKEKLKKIKSGELTAEKNVAQFGSKIQKLNKELNIYLVLNTNAIKQAKEIDKKIKSGKQVGKLAGLCFAVKSNICVKDLETNCASKVLESYIPGYNATVIQKLIEEDAIILGMVNMDEFACGSSGETSAFNPTKNPRNKELIPGGTSSGSAAASSDGAAPAPDTPITESPASPETEAAPEDAAALRKDALHARRGQPNDPRRLLDQTGESVFRPINAHAEVSRRLDEGSQHRVQTGGVVASREDQNSSGLLLLLFAREIVIRHSRLSFQRFHTWRSRSRPTR